MAERTGDYQGEVLSDLLDLQAELRGETREEAAAPAAPDVVPVEDARPDDEIVTVAASGLQVSVAPTGAAVTERLAALNERLSHLEASLATITARIEGVEAQPPAAEEPDADAPWRSFLDLQKIVADRLDRS